uniref:Uncharacterized protein n=1 Tax=Rhizophora mucronata TaxID=61149 RepID=A0A2P2Q5Q5_RHIMU
MCTLHVKVQLGRVFNFPVWKFCLNILSLFMISLPPFFFPYNLF